MVPRRTFAREQVESELERTSFAAGERIAVGEREGERDAA